MCAILGGILHLTVEAPTSNLLASSMRQRKVQSKKSEMKSQMESKIKSEVKNANLNNNNIDGLKSKNEESNHVKQD